MYYFKPSLGILLLFILSLFFLKSSKSQGCTPPPSGMVGWWPFDNNTNDIVGGHNGIQHGGTFNMGKVLQGYKSLNNSNLIEIPDHNDLDLSDSLSFDAWITINSLNQQNSVIIWKGNPYGTDYTSPYCTFIFNQNSIYAGKVGVVLGDGSNSQLVASNSTIPLNTPTFIAVVIDTALIKIYINGVLDTTTTKTIIPHNSSYPLQIGGEKNSPSGASVFFNGVIDEVELFNRTLTINEIQAIYNAGSYGKCKSGCINPVYSTDNQTACNSYTWINGNTYTSNNTTATHTISGGATNGCDSIITLSLTILQPSYRTDNQTACSSYIWIDGNTYTSNNTTATRTIPGGATNGCDSIITLNLTILQPSYKTDNQTACSSYTWIDGNTYSSNNTTATHTISGGAANGCDSIITLNLIISQPSYKTDNQTACSSYTWIDGNTYSSNNTTATHTISGGAANGCDSIITLNLTILQPAHSTYNKTACNSYKWIDGNTYTSNNTTATHIISGGAINGCDSIIQLNLTIQTVDSTVSRNGNTLNANQSGATYQWLTCKNGKYPITGATGQSFSPLTNGSYAVQISSGKCKATSDCLLFTKVSVDKITDRKFIVSAFPNPIDEVLYIKLNHGTWPSNQPIIAEIFDVTGKQIISKSIQSERTLINTKTFKRGVYFIQVKVAHKAIYSGKIIK